MISIYDIKPKFQALLTPIVQKLHNAGCTANQITFFAIMLSLLTGVLFYFADNVPWFLLIIPLLLLIRMALNAIDGLLARQYNQQTAKGKVLNDFGDVISDFFIFFPLLKIVPHTYLIVLFICLSIINEFAGVMGELVGSKRRYDGPMGKSDRVLFISIYCLLTFFVPSFSSVMVIFFAIGIGLLIISTYTRLTKSIQHI